VHVCKIQRTLTSPSSESEADELILPELPSTPQAGLLARGRRRIKKTFGDDFARIDDDL